jgi:hypothetical protein
MYAWIFIHFLNCIASFAMHGRMNAKFKLLSNPPVYTPIQDNLPPYSPQPQLDTGSKRAD